MDDDYLLQGVNHINLDSHDEIAKLAAKVEKRATGGTLMNDSSSRSHCVTSLLLFKRDLSTN
jgi:hypothetical protein